MEALGEALLDFHSKTDLSRWCEGSMVLAVFEVHLDRHSTDRIRDESHLVAAGAGSL
jgi:hypothetical protein